MKLWNHASPLSEAPAFLLLICLCVFLMMNAGMGLPYALSAAVSLLLPAGWALIGTVKPNPSSAPVAASLFVAALCCIAALLYGVSPKPFPIKDGERFEAAAKVLSSSKWGFGSVALVESAELKARFVLRLSGLPPAPGDRIVFSGTLRNLKRAAPREFDEFLYWKAKGAQWAVETLSVETVGQAQGFALWRRTLANRIRDVLPPLTAGYMLAMAAGEKEGTLAALHRSVGTSHLLAVSGFHVGIVWGACRLLFEGLRCRLQLVSVCIWAYVLLSGAAPSAVRAASMIQVLLLGRMLGLGHGKPLNTVSAAGSAMLLFNPWLFWDVGWRLSMLSMLALASVPSIDRMLFGQTGELKKRKYRMTFLACSLVWLLTSVQGAWTFGDVPLAGLFINFIAIPAFGFMFPVALVASIPALLGLWGGSAVALIPEFLFARWEVFSSNAAYLLPLKISFSSSFALIGTSLAVFCGAAASGFTAARSFAVSVLLLFGVSLFLLAQ